MAVAAASSSALIGSGSGGCDAPLGAESAGPGLDYQFRCNYCIRLIGQDSEVYMRNDLSYCSSSCRRKGRSALYSNLQAVQLERCQNRYGAPSESVVSAEYSFRKSAGSESSIITKTSVRSSQVTSTDAATEAGTKPGRLRWAIGKVVDVIAARLPELPMVRAASHNLLDQLQPGGRLHGTFSHYVPQVASLVTLTQAPSLTNLSGENSSSSVCSTGTVGLL